MFQFQSPRQDVVDSIRNAIKLDYENSLKLEQGKWERQLQQLKEEHEQTLVIIFLMSAFFPTLHTFLYAKTKIS